MFIECSNPKTGPMLINSKRVRAFRVVASKNVREVSTGTGSVLYHHAPDSDFCVVAYLSSGPAFLTGAIKEPDARALLTGILESIDRQARVFSVPTFLRAAKASSRDGPKKALSLSCNPAQPGGDTPAI